MLWKESTLLIQEETEVFKKMAAYQLTVKSLIDSLHPYFKYISHNFIYIQQA